jgi:hypothetical protein
MSRTGEDFEWAASGATYFQGGWARYHDSRHPEPVWVRVQPTPEGRLVIRELYLTADNDLGSERIDTDQLRRLSPARIEATLNSAPSKALILERLGQAPGPKEPRGPAKPSPMVRGSTSGRVIGEGLRPPPGRPRPDSFYQDVANEYLLAASVNARPAVVLATAAEVPVSTMHGWIKEARRRGFLPPGQKGRRG